MLILIHKYVDFVAYSYLFQATFLQRASTCIQMDLVLLQHIGQAEGIKDTATVLDIILGILNGACL